jgi:hypothetical protein
MARVVSGLPEADEVLRRSKVVYVIDYEALRRLVMGAYEWPGETPDYCDIQWDDDGGLQVTVRPD